MGDPSPFNHTRWTIAQIVCVGLMIAAITAGVAVATWGLTDMVEENSAIDAECAARGMTSTFLTLHSDMKTCVRDDGTMVLPDRRRKDPPK